jgi:hypothetical protein
VTTRHNGIRLRFEVARAPDPALLRAAILGRLAGRTAPGVEGELALHIATAVDAQRMRTSGFDPPGGGAWR